MLTLREQMNYEIDSNKSLSKETATELDVALKTMFWKIPTGADAISRKTTRSHRRQEEIDYDNALQVKRGFEVRSKHIIFLSDII